MRTKNRYYFILFHILFLFIIGLKNSVWVMIRDSSFPFTEEEKKKTLSSLAGITGKRKQEHLLDKIVL